MLPINSWYICVILSYCPPFFGCTFFEYKCLHCFLEIMPFYLLISSCYIVFFPLTSVSQQFSPLQKSSILIIGWTLETFISSSSVFCTHLQGSYHSYFCFSYRVAKKHTLLILQPHNQMWYLNLKIHSKYLLKSDKQYTDESSSHTFTF